MCSARLQRTSYLSSCCDLWEISQFRIRTHELENPAQTQHAKSDILTGLIEASIWRTRIARTLHILNHLYAEETPASAGGLHCTLIQDPSSRSKPWHASGICSNIPNFVAVRCLICLPGNLLLPGSLDWKTEKLDTFCLCTTWFRLSSFCMDLLPCLIGQLNQVNRSSANIFDLKAPALVKVEVESRNRGTRALLRKQRESFPSSSWCCVCMCVKPHRKSFQTENPSSDIEVCAFPLAANQKVKDSIWSHTTKHRQNQALPSCICANKCSLSLLIFINRQWCATIPVRWSGRRRRKETDEANKISRHSRVEFWCKKKPFS